MGINLQKHEKLKRKFSATNFAEQKKNTALLFYITSIIGNIFSILFAFFFVNQLTKNIPQHIPGQYIILPIFIVIFLTMFEILKRVTFADVVENFFLSKESKKKIGAMVFSVTFSLFLILGSFYLSVNGARTFVNNRGVQVEVIDSIKTKETTVIDSVFNIEQGRINKEIDYIYSAANSRRRNKSLTQEENLRVNELKQEKLQLEKKKDLQTAAIIKQTDIKHKDKLSSTDKGIAAFGFISIFIELAILVGVLYFSFYQIKSFKQNEELLEENKNYSLRIQYLKMLRVLYNNGKVKVNHKLPSFNQIKELINLSQQKKISDKTIKDFLTLLNHLKITEVQGKSRVIISNFDLAIEKIENHLPLEI